MAGERISFNPIEKLFSGHTPKLIDNYFTATPKNVANKGGHNAYSSDWEKWMAQAGAGNSHTGATYNK